MASQTAAIDGSTGEPRALRRPVALPNGRAVVGGLLVAAAMLGVLLASTADGAGSRERFVVARTALTVGSVLTRGDLTLAPMHLSSPLATARAFRDPRRLVGSVVVAPVAAGELVQASAVADKATPSDREMSVRVDAHLAVNGRVQLGDVVDVAATFGSGDEAYTVFVVRGATVIARATSGGALGDHGQEVLTLGLASSSDALAVAHAVAAGQVSVVRATGGRPAGAEPYRAPSVRGAVDG